MPLGWLPLAIFDLLTRPGECVHAPNGALAAADGQVAARVSRLLKPAPRLPVAAVALIGVVAIATVAIPAAFLTMPF